MVKNSATDNDVGWTSNYLPKSGGILTGKTGINAISSAMGLSFSTYDSTGDVQLSVGIGESHDNHGLYSDTLGKWLIYASKTDNEIRIEDGIKIGTTGYLNAGITTLSNANGKTIRFTNGIQICFGEVRGTTDATSTTMGSANIYYAQADWTFPNSFKEVWQVQVTALDLANGFYIAECDGAPTTTKVKISMGGNAQSSVGAYVMAIGTWK